MNWGLAEWAEPSRTGSYWAAGVRVHSVSKAFFTLFPKMRDGRTYLRPGKKSDFQSAPFKCTESKKILGKSGLFSLDLYTKTFLTKCIVPLKNLDDVYFPILRTLFYFCWELYFVKLNKSIALSENKYTVSELEVTNYKRLEMIEILNNCRISCLYLQEHKKGFAFLSKFQFQKKIFTFLF